MHDTAFQIGTLAMNIYTDLANASVLEIGSQSFNGSLRINALPTTKYIGLDLEEGEGVDMVIEPGKPFPVEAGSFDLVMASSVFEHDPCFWATFLEMCRVTKDGGYIYINAPSNGRVHRYPQDHWRFYPDCGLALQRWAVEQGLHVTLVESFVAEREDDIWNDFVAVFRKGKITGLLPSTLLHEHVASVNVRTWKGSDVLRQRDEPQDEVLLQQAQAESERLATEIARLEDAERAAGQRAMEAAARQQESDQQLELLREKVAAADQQVVALIQSTGETDALRSELSRREKQLAEVQSELAAANARLDQHGAESEQLRAELRDIAGELTAQRSKMVRSDAILQKALAERSALEGRLTKIEDARQQDLRLLEERTGRLQALEGEVQQTRAGLAVEAARRKVSSENKARLEREIGELRARSQSLEEKDQERVGELANITVRLQRQEGRNHELQQQLEWVAAVRRCIEGQPAWWTLMPPRWREQRVRRRLVRASLFDHDAYLNRYPDVAQSGMDALDHYERHGFIEGRSNGLV